MTPKIVLSLFSKAGQGHPVGSSAKSYPTSYADLLVKMLREKEFHLIQLGVEGEYKLDVQEHFFNRSFEEIKEICQDSKAFISIDSFLPHLCHYFNINTGIVIFSKSDPEIFGYHHYTNLLKDRAFLRKDQFDYWKNEKKEERAFVSPPKVVFELEKFFNSN
jgi:ADP-heptose:LPS heptosyltransferase